LPRQTANARVTAGLKCPPEVMAQIVIAKVIPRPNVVLISEALQT
jgi:hypothetical protein